MKLIGSYVNGNYTVQMYDDGTKVRTTEGQEFVPAFAENCDVKITDKCDGGCEFCYEGCTVQGHHADLLSAKWVDTLHPYTELAINGNDLSHPQLIPFLEKLKRKNIIANMTVNQKHFMEHLDFINELVRYNLIHGLGVSLVDASDEFIEAISHYPNAVIHVINGILSEAQWSKLMHHDLKILILGYKDIRRGATYYRNNTEEVKANQENLYNSLNYLFSGFRVVSFDNLAIEQLDVKRFLSEEEWEEFFMGEDGHFTFYIDMVKNEFAKNSLSSKRYKIMDNVDDMFKFILQQNEEN